MTNESVPFQTVSLDNDRTVALFSKDGRVFYELSTLVAAESYRLIKSIESRGGVQSEYERAYFYGARDVLERILTSSQMLSAEYSLGKANTVEDLFDN